ncbi:N-acyl homoserine lactonase family protein [Tomitella cavernea]|uniref:N-acyl homoserine lactonase family protein n=1 Tax=Tomitella cavernea TaxID=1387982 RepID=A0ABP9C4R8_9ACTN|nr:N-acyl homoserine lactonase family protein [Tomitella cavernea]
MTGPTAVRMHGLAPATYRSPQQVQLLGDAAPRLPFPIYLIEHDDGLVLFDGGLDSSAAGDPVGVYGEMAERIDIRFTAEQRLDRQLAGLGFAVDDIKTVIASHLHFDHAGALKEFPHARTLIGRGEIKYARDPELFARGWFRPEDFDDAHGIRWETIDADTDVFGDGAVTALYLPGHTPGSLATMVRLPARTLILGADVVHARAALDSETAYQGDVDTLTARRSIRRMKKLAADTGADIWVCHDPDDWARFGAGEIT